MDLVKAIRDLYEEKKRLDAVIASLEMMIAADTQFADHVSSAHRRGRKSMSRDERREVSERMKRYWAARREQMRPTDNQRTANAASSG